MKLKRNKSQTLLETAIVFVSLAALAVGMLRLFTTFNENIFSRLRLYKDSRLKVVNNLIQGIGPGMDPKKYLEFAKSNPFGLPYIPDPGRFNEYLLHEQRVATAQLYLKDFDNLLNFTLPYMLNQAKEIQKNMTPGLEAGDPGKFARYVSEIQQLCQEMIEMCNTVYGKVFGPGGARDLLIDVYIHPTPNGPYDQTPCLYDDPFVCSDPRLPQFTGDYPCSFVDPQAQRACTDYNNHFARQYRATYNALVKSVDQGRRMLNQTQWALFNARNPVYQFFYDIPFSASNMTGKLGGHWWLKRDLYGIKGRLEFIRDNIGMADHSDPFWGQHDSRSNSIKVLDELMSNLGAVISPCMFSNTFADQVTAVNALINGDLSEESVRNARDIVTNWTETLFFNTTGGTGGVVDLTDAIADLKGKGYNIETTDFSSSTGISYTRNIALEIAADLNSALESWNDPDPDKFNKNNYLANARLDVGALYRITGVNRRGNYP